MSGMDESTLSTDLAAETRAAAAGALGAVFSGAAGHGPDGSGASAAFDVQARRGAWRMSVRGSDGDGASPPPPRSPPRRVCPRARRASRRTGPSRRLLPAASGSVKERFPVSFGEKKTRDRKPPPPRTPRTLSRISPRASSAKILAASPTALSAWLEAVTRLKRRADPRRAAAWRCGAFATRGRFIFKTPTRVVAALVAAIAERLSDPREVLSTRVGAAGCASALALARVVAETPGESAFVARVAALRFVGEASASASARDPSATRAQLRQLARLAATATKTLCAWPRNTNGGIMRTSVAADLARAAEEAAGIGAAAAHVRRRRRL